jgi:uncharacterized protein (TIRG00374 family)
VSLITVASVMVLLAAKRGALAMSLGRIAHSHWSWIPAAIALELVSMGTFALMQRQLLGAGGIRVGCRPMMATILAANALSVSVPVAGPELGAAFTFRRFKKLGADTSLASWALVVGGLVSWVGAILILGAGGALSGNVLVTGAALLAAVLVIAAGIAVRSAMDRSRLHPLIERPAAWMIRRVARLLSHPVDHPHQAIQSWVMGLHTLRPSRSAWGKVGALGVANWLTDASVLAISVLAVGAPVPWRTLLLIYAVATVIGSLGITPGGIGLVEGTLCLGLVGTGLPAALALAAVLLYRLVSFWLVMAIGCLVLLYLRLERPAQVMVAGAH